MLPGGRGGGYKKCWVAALLGQFIVRATVRRINSVYVVSISLIKNRMDEGYKLNIFSPQIIEE